MASPCHNGGTCVSSDPFSYSCLCIAGCSGSACEDDADECLSERGVSTWPDLL